MKKRTGSLCTLLLFFLILCLFSAGSEPDRPACTTLRQPPQEPDTAKHPARTFWTAPDTTTEYAYDYPDVLSLAQGADLIIYGEVTGIRPVSKPLYPLASVEETVKVLDSCKGGLPEQTEITVIKEDGIFSQIGQREVYFLSGAFAFSESQNAYCPLNGSLGEYLELPDGRFSLMYSLLSASFDQPPKLTDFSGTYSYEELMKQAGIENP